MSTEGMFIAGILSYILIYMACNKIQISIS